MHINRLSYLLPKKLIAQQPLSPRDSSRLLLIDRRNNKNHHHKFHEIIDFLNSNDVLVFNQTKVFPARLIGKKKTGGKAEVLLLKRLKGNLWEAITKPGFFVRDEIDFEGFEAKVTGRKNYITKIKFSISGQKLITKIEQIGKTPLPPYIKPLNSEEKLRRQYQTVYAKVSGSAAAPTAGFHFTKRLFKKLKEKGVQMEYVTLHVGLGTFAPIKEKDITKHEIHEEYFELNKNTAKKLNAAKKLGKRIIAVGTTTARVLETLATQNCNLKTDNLKGVTNLFIYPPYKFKFVDALITNFHLPKSTLLALVSAFVSYPNTKTKFTDFRSSLVGLAYQDAVKKRYRFFSFGDACLIF